MDIRSELEAAWKETVKEDYREGGAGQPLASERDRGPSLDLRRARMVGAPGARERRRLVSPRRIKSPAASVFLEAGMLAGESGATRPTDVVLCEDSDVRLIAEIKFVPQGYPEWEQDIQKLNAITQLDKNKGHEFLIDPANASRGYQTVKSGSRRTG